MKMFDIRKWNIFHFMYAYIWGTVILVLIAQGITKIIELCH